MRSRRLTTRRFPSRMSSSPRPSPPRAPRRPTATGATSIRSSRMDVFEAVESRLSCRAFLDKPVDPALVRDLVARASRAASGGNLQPWRVYALTGAPLAELKQQVARTIDGQ